ncbi:MAG: hypothetical protein Q9182_004103 [Xanthomendoza sp. 2 TL-2023]
MDKERANVKVEAVHDRFELVIHGAHGKQKVILPKFAFAIHAQCGEREWLSLFENISADDYVLPPWVITKGERQQKARRRSYRDERNFMDEQ